MRWLAVYTSTETGLLDDMTGLLSLSGDGEDDGGTGRRLFMPEAAAHAFDNHADFSH
jgi:hypothetical protein